MTGSSYPNALGHNDGNDEPMPVEGENLECLPRMELTFTGREREYDNYVIELCSKNWRQLSDTTICQSLSLYFVPYLTLKAVCLT